MAYNHHDSELDWRNDSDFQERSANSFAREQEYEPFRECCDDLASYTFHEVFDRDSDTGYQHESYWQCVCGESIPDSDFRALMKFEHAEQPPLWQPIDETTAGPIAPLPDTRPIIAPTRSPRKVA